MKFYYPTHNVYGLGAYKCIYPPMMLGGSIKFVDYINPIELVHIEEIKNLKYKLQTECLN